MKVSRAVAFWVAVIAVLLLLEVAQITHLFHLGFTSILSNVLSFVFALLLVTVLALVGAVFVGIFIAHRILSPQGFSPFEEEMMRMRGEVHDLTKKVDDLQATLAARGGDPPTSATPARGLSTEAAPGSPGERGGSP